MLNDNAKKWVVALRSGEYKQTTNQLYNADEDAYCCLGVACAISGLSWNKQLSLLPDVVQKWLGLYSANGHYFGDGWLVNDNDVYHKTFAEIADIIELEPEGLFANDRN